MPTILVGADNGSQHAERLRGAVDLVNRSQRHFHLEMLNEPVALGTPFGAISGKAVAEQIAAEYPAHKVICLSDRPFDDNWFSHEYRHCAIITASDWETQFAPPSLRSYLVYQIAQALLPLEADLSEEMLLRLAHEPPVGCLNDLSSHKPDIKYGLVAGNMCLQCEGLLRQFGVDPAALDAVRQLLAVVRDDTIGRPRMVDPDSAFVVMRFTRNDENDNAYRYGVVHGLTAVGLKPQRADDTVRSSQLLDKIMHYLERSRFVVAKVDVENLNVYFELGLAMGLGKDVLLISEASLVLNLPSDLRNWECLTYDHGNYEQLRERVTDFFRKTYHLAGGNR